MPMDKKLTEIFLSIQGGLARAVSSIVPPKEVEDIVQETYVRACQVSKNEISSPHSFMYKTARNIALNYVNRAESRLSQSYENIEDFIDLDLNKTPLDLIDQVSADEEFALLCESVRRLPLQCRRVFVLKKVYGHSQREIAEMLSISEKTVENHVSNGIHRCRQHALRHQSQGRKGTGTNHTSKNMLGEKP